MFSSTPPASSVSREATSSLLGGLNTRWYTSVCMCVCNVHAKCLSITVSGGEQFNTSSEGVYPFSSISLNEDRV